MSRKFGLVAVGVGGEKEGELVSLENVLRYWRVFVENDVVLPIALRTATSSCR